MIKELSSLKMLEDRKIFIKEANDFKTHVSYLYETYNTFLIAYDICNYDYYNIESAIKKGKYDINLVKEIYELACSMCSKLQFNMDLLNLN